jgi:hypothetical protein
MDTGASPSVTFNNLPVEVLSAMMRRLVVRTPATVTSGPVVVTLKGIRSNSVHFAIEGAPVLTRVTPDAASARTEVRIEGRGFSTTLTQNSVRFGGVTAVVRSAAESLLVAVVPEGASSGSVIVRVGSLESNPLPFTVLPTR